MGMRLSLLAVWDRTIASNGGRRYLRERCMAVAEVPEGAWVCDVSHNDVVRSSLHLISGKPLNYIALRGCISFHRESYIYVAAFLIDRFNAWS